MVGQTPYMSQDMAGMRLADALYTSNSELTHCFHYISHTSQLSQCSVCSLHIYVGFCLVLMCQLSTEPNTCKTTFYLCCD